MVAAGDAAGVEQNGGKAAACAEMAASEAERQTEDAEEEADEDNGVAEEVEELGHRDEH